MDYFIPFNKNKERIQKFQRNRKFEIYLSKKIRQSLLSALYGFC